MRKIFLYDHAACIGCASCQMACKDEHGLLPGEFFRKVSFQTVFAKGQEKTIPFSLSCNHCDDPACVSACPTGAMRKESDGLVLHDNGLCIGCGRCFWACPYGEISISKRTGLAQKCDSCAERRSRGEAPACVAACPTGSLLFGEREELCGEKLEAVFLPDYSITQPSTRLRGKTEKEQGQDETL